MTRSAERLIDVLVLAMLLSFAYLMRESAPELAGGIAVAACAFWLTKNASAPSDPTVVEAAATAAAEILRAAERKAAAEEKRSQEPSPVEIVGQSDAVEVDVVEKKEKP